MEAFASSQADEPAWIGRYRIVGRLGGGGMGRVYLALSPGGRAVAVKVVRAGLADDPGFRRRFVREVEAARRVSGLFTASVVDADPEGSPPWLATEYVPGMSLEAAVQAHGAWPTATVPALGAALAEALESVHAAGVVHRDLKPSNVLLAADGPRLIDFGIAQAAETTELTETGMVIGTPGFISPERLVDDEDSAAGDVFALGAVLAYAATGSGPFGTGHAHALNYRVVHEEPELTGLPPELADVVARCLAKAPDRRPTVPELVEELGRASETGQAAGFFTEAGWLPAPVATEIIGARSAPLLAPADDAAPPPAPSGMPPPLRGGRARRRILAGLAVAAALSLATATVVLAGPWSGDGEDAGATGPPLRKELWNVALGEGMSLARVVGGTVYLADHDGNLQALDGDNGRLVWKRGYDAEGDGVPTGPRLLEATDTMVYFGTDTHTYALDARSGAELWKREDGGLHPRLAVAGGTYYAAVTGLSAHDTGTGREIWKNDYDSLSTKGPVVAGGVVYLVTKDGFLYAVDAETGADLWRLKVGDQMESGIVAADGTVYFGTRDGALHAINSATGREAWKQRFDGDSWDPAIAEGAGAPIIVDGIVYFENDGYVCAFAADTGKPMWRHKPELDEVHLLSVRNGQVLFGDGEEAGNLYALDARTGDRLWREHLGGSPSIIEGRLYVEDGDVLRVFSVTG